MAMNFWEAQRRARARTAWYMTAFVVLTIGMAIVAELSMRSFDQEIYDPPLPYVGLAFLGITFLVALFQYGQFRRQGGAYVAESLGGVRIDPQHASPKEQMLLNIVEEMAVAASIPVPPVYLLNASEINAFAAGLTPNDAVVAFTVGCLQKLTRDELQGVVAHELGHIDNADMTISMRIAAMVMGFFFVLYIGMRMLQVASISSGGRASRRGGNPIALAALIFLAAGAITWLAGSILKSMISRQREYLADACSVQFTRNPNAIANTLRKIANDQIRDMPRSGIAYSHMYFEDRSFLSRLFATHPPISKRIAAIEGRTYIPKDWNIPSSS